MDLVRAYYDVDCCIMNAGCIRIDALIPAGELRYSLLSNIINDSMIVMEMMGSTILRALEHAVEGLPGFPGSFLNVAGIMYTFDINKSPRVQEVYINNLLLNENKKYLVALNSYISKGGDGFDMFK